MGELADLESGTPNLKKVAEAMNDRYLDKPMCLSNLGVGQQARFERLGGLADLDNAIATTQKATVAGHPEGLALLASVLASKNVLNTSANWWIWITPSLLTKRRSTSRKIKIHTS